MGILRQRVGAAQHKRGSVQHVIKIEDPRRRHVHDVALNTSTQTTAISKMISQAAALPHHVLISSMINRNFWTVIGRRQLFRGKIEMTKHHPAAFPNGALPVQCAFMSSSRFLSARSSNRTPSCG